MKGTGDKAKFLAQCYYFHGQYDSQDAFTKLDKILKEKEDATKLQKANRVSLIYIKRVDKSISTIVITIDFAATSLIII